VDRCCHTLFKSAQRRTYQLLTCLPVFCVTVHSGILCLMANMENICNKSTIHAVTLRSGMLHKMRITYMTLCRWNEGVMPKRLTLFTTAKKVADYSILYVRWQPQYCYCCHCRIVYFLCDFSLTSCSSSCIPVSVQQLAWQCNELSIIPSGVNTATSSLTYSSCRQNWRIVSW